MKTIKKAQTGAKTKKTDLNTTIQKAKLDNKYNKIYAAMKQDSIKESNKILPETYEKLRRRNSGKSPSVEKLRAEQDKYNKKIVKESKAKKLNTKLDARGRTENAMINNAMNSYKSGGAVKKKMKNGGALGMKSVKAGFDKNPGVTRADIITAAKGEAKKGMKVKKAQMGSVINKMAKKNQTSAPKVPKGLSTIKRPDDSMKSTIRTTMKSGGKMKKCRYGCK
jgi:hypothetical protein